MDGPVECNGHSHDHLDHEDGLGLSLRPLIDFPKVRCLNESRPNSGRDILKLHEERLSSTPSLISQEDDPELLLYIPFTEAVTITFIAIRSIVEIATTQAQGNNNDNQSFPTAPPRNIKLFTNRDDLDFDTARDMDSQMSMELLPPHHFVDGTIDYPLRPAGRFQNISSLTILVLTNYGTNVTGAGDNDDDDDDEISTIITYVGLKGKGSKQKRMAVETVYESRAMPKDHQVKGGEFGSHHLL